MFRAEAIDRCKKLGYEVRLVGKLIKPEGYEPMTEGQFKDWVRATEAHHKASRN